MALLTGNLPSGYHRDMQLTKEIVFPAIDTINDCLKMMFFSLQNIQVKSDLLNGPPFDLLFTVEEVNKHVVAGMPFRDAYKVVGNAVNEGTFSSNKKLHHTHTGSINNPGNEQVKAMMQKTIEKIID